MKADTPGQEKKTTAGSTPSHSAGGWEESFRGFRNRMGFHSLNAYWRLRERILPRKTRRRQVFEKGIAGLQILRREGPRGLWERIRERVEMDVLKRKHGSGSDPGSPQADGYAGDYAARMAQARGERGSEYVPLAETDFSCGTAPVRLIAFYLPQFHPIPENDEWWGRGFTEWTNVSKAVPQFVGHYQPRIPGELGYYDLRVPEVQRRQVQLAGKYGIHGFCFYYYWFHGKRLLERPLEQFLADAQIDFPFCLCWANENWTRQWDGREQDVLIGQDHSAENDLAFIRDVEPILRHRNYIRINGRPLLVVYRAQLMTDPAATAKRWRAYCREAGVGDPYLTAAQTFGFTDPREAGFDAAVEFPPNNCHAPSITPTVTMLNRNFTGKICRYMDVVKIMVRRPKPPYPLFKTVVTGWDNEPRRPGRSHIYAFSSPDAYQYWLTEACRFSKQDADPEKRLVFINAWNEWTEGTYLEPDRKYGYAYLQATAEALCSVDESNGTGIEGKSDPLQNTIVKRNDTAVILHVYYPELWDEIKSYLTNLENRFDLFVTIPSDVNISDEIIKESFSQAVIIRCENRGRDVAPFLKVFHEIYPLGYRYLCKIHTKKSSHRETGDAWRRTMLEKLLGSKQTVRNAKTALNSHRNWGIIAPKGHVLPYAFYRGSNERYIDNLAKRIGLPSEDIAFSFAAGSMFWFRPEVFRLLPSLHITTTDFDLEKGQVDGTLAHAFERFFGLLAYHEGFKIAEISPDGVTIAPDPLKPMKYEHAD